MREQRLFGVSRIASEIGLSRQSVHLRLSGIVPDGQIIVNGQLANAWRAESLPEMLRSRLETLRERRGFRSIEHMLSGPVERYQSPVPLSELASSAREQALRLMFALRPFLQRRNSPEAQSKVFAQRGVEEYKRVFGYRISERYWSKLLNRVIQRDSEYNEWDRLELYLSDSPTRLRSSVACVAAREHKLQILEIEIDRLSGSSRLSLDDHRSLWTKACDELSAQLAVGANPRKTKRAIVKALVETGLVGGVTDSVHRQLNYKYEQYCSNGFRLPRDGRSVRDQRRRLPKADREKLIARSALDCGGRVRQAFRELRDEGELSSETLSRTISNPRHKSYIPASIAREIATDVKQVHELHRSLRDFELKGPYVPQDETKIASGEVFQLDDVTLPVYYWETDPNAPGGVFFGRGQWILAIDIRSRLILGHALHSAPVYNMRIVRGLLLRVHDEFGLPERLLLERGMWRTAKIIKGDELDMTHTEQGLREFGVTFQHRTKPRGKIIERVIGLVQNQMERFPGYVGRDERRDRHDEVQKQALAVTSGREHPSAYFLSKDQWLRELDTLIHAYNNEPQSGKLGGASPVESWNLNLLPQGTVHLGMKARYLLAHHKKPIKVQRGGIRLPPSLGGGLYYGTATGGLVGRQMLAWINPDAIDAIVLTSLDRREGPYLVERAEALSPIAASGAELTAAQQRQSAHNDYARTLYRAVRDKAVKRSFRRLWHIDEETVQLGQKIAAHQATRIADLAKSRRAINSAQRLVKSQNLRVVVSAKNADRAAAAAKLTREAYGEGSNP